jgi:hypothetical protein
MAVVVLLAVLGALAAFVVIFWWKASDGRIAGAPSGMPRDPVADDETAGPGGAILLEAARVVISTAIAHSHDQDDDHDHDDHDVDWD